MKKSLLTLALLLAFGSVQSQPTIGKLNWLGGDTGAVFRGGMPPAGYTFQSDGTNFVWAPADTGGGGSGGTVTSVGLTAPTGLSVSGSPVTTSGTLALTYTAGYQGYTSSEASKLSGIASGATNNPSTTVGANFLNLTNPSAVGYVRTNADNTVTHRSYANVLSDIGAAPTASPTFTGMLTGDSATLNYLNVGVLVGAADLDSAILTGITPGNALTVNADGKVIGNSAFKMGSSQLAFFNGTLRSKITLDCPTVLADFNPVTNTEDVRACLYDLVQNVLRSGGYNLVN